MLKHVCARGKALSLFVMDWSENARKLPSLLCRRREGIADKTRVTQERQQSLAGTEVKNCIIACVFTVGTPWSTTTLDKMKPSAARGVAMARAA